MLRNEKIRYSLRGSVCVGGGGGGVKGGGGNHISFHFVAVMKCWSHFRIP